MATVSTTLRRKMVSEVIKGTSTVEEVNGVNHLYKRVDLFAASDTDVAVGAIGVWVDANDQYELAGAASVIGTEAGSAMGAKVVVVVGPREGIGQPGDGEDGKISVTTTGTEVTVLCIGPAQVLRDGLEYTAQSIGSGVQTAIENQLQLQHISLGDSAEEVTPSFIV